MQASWFWGVLLPSEPGSYCQTLNNKTYFKIEPTISEQRKQIPIRKQPTLHMFSDEELSW